MFEHTLSAQVVHDNVRVALAEDLGDGDLSGQLMRSDQQASATVMVRDAGVFCGRPWVDATFTALDAKMQLHWQVDDGDAVAPGQQLLRLRGSARALLAGERTALNFAQLLSATATLARRYAQALADSPVQVLDTRKTIPGLRHAQKYAVACGGGGNHRMGLFDAFLIKENHITAAGSIDRAVARARQMAPEVMVEVEVENFDELRDALQARADVIMLDEFAPCDWQQAVDICAGHAKLEISGGVGLDDLPAIAAAGVDYVSVGALTKNIQALDLSLRMTCGDL